MKLVCRFIEERIEQPLVSKNSNETEDVVLHGGTLEQWRYIYDGRKFDFFLSLNDFFFLIIMIVVVGFIDRIEN